MLMAGPCSPFCSGFASRVTRAVITLATLAMGSGFPPGVDASTPAPSAPIAAWASDGQGRSTGLPGLVAWARLCVAPTAPTGRNSLTSRRTSSSVISPRAILDGRSHTTAIELSRADARTTASLALWSFHGSEHEDPAPRGPASHSRGGINRYLHNHADIY